MSERQGERGGRDRRARDRKRQKETERGNTEREREKYWGKLLPLSILYRGHFYNVYNGKWYIPHRMITWMNVLSWYGTSIEKQDGLDGSNKGSRSQWHKEIRTHEMLWSSNVMGVAVDCTIVTSYKNIGASFLTHMCRFLKNIH